MASTLPPPATFITEETTVMPATTAPQTTHLWASPPVLQVFSPFSPAISVLNSGHTFPTAPITPAPIQKLCNKQVQ